MADSIECFNIGSIVNCKTCFNEDYEGEVVAYDGHVNLLALKSNSATGRSSSSDVFLVNLNYVSQMDVIKEASGSPLPILPSLDLIKLHNRVKENVEKKERLLKALQSGCTIDAQRIFNTIGKTIDDVNWCGSDILVMKHVVISAPYMPDNVKGFKDSKDMNINAAITHIRKIVEKFYKDKSVNGDKSPSAIPHTNTEAPAQVQPLSQ